MELQCRCMNGLQIYALGYLEQDKGVLAQMQSLPSQLS